MFIIDKFASLTAIFVALATTLSIIFNFTFLLSLDDPKVIYMMTIGDHVVTITYIWPILVPVSISYIIYIIFIDLNSKQEIHLKIKNLDIGKKMLFTIVSLIILSPFVYLLLIYPAFNFPLMALGGVSTIIKEIFRSDGDLHYFLVLSISVPFTVAFTLLIIMVLNEDKSMSNIYARIFLLSVLFFILVVVTVSMAIINSRVKENGEVSIIYNYENHSEKLALVRGFERGALFWSYRSKKTIFLTWRALNRLEQDPSSRWVEV